MDKASTWRLIHARRAATADMLESLTPEQWAALSLCAGWTIQDAAGHILAGAENTKGHFMKRLAENGFRFNKMIDVDAKIAGELSPADIIARLRARTTTTNSPPAPTLTMLGEVVTHTEDIRQPLGLATDGDPESTVACLGLYATSGFPLGSKKRIDGLRFSATDVEWTRGDGPEVSGPGLSLLLAMAGRQAGLEQLTGEGVATLRERF